MLQLTRKPGLFTTVTSGARDTNIIRRVASTFAQWYHVVEMYFRPKKRVLAANPTGSPIPNNYCLPRDSFALDIMAVLQGAPFRAISATLVGIFATPLRCVFQPILSIGKVVLTVGFTKLRAVLSRISPAVFLILLSVRPVMIANRLQMLFIVSTAPRISLCLDPFLVFTVNGISLATLGIQFILVFNVSLVLLSQNFFSVFLVVPSLILTYASLIAFVIFSFLLEYLRAILLIVRLLAFSTPIFVAIFRLLRAIEGSNCFDLLTVAAPFRVHISRRLQNYYSM